MSKQRKKLKDTAKEIVSLVFILALCMYSTASMIGILLGVIDAGDHGTLFETRCNKPFIRAEYVLPAYRLGCWLGSESK